MKFVLLVMKNILVSMVLVKKERCRITKKSECTDASEHHALLQAKADYISEISLRSVHRRKGEDKAEQMKVAAVEQVKQIKAAAAKEVEAIHKAAKHSSVKEINDRKACRLQRKTS